jgi:hypothetical protein
MMTPKTPKTDYTSDFPRFFADLYPVDTGAAIIPEWLQSLLYQLFPLPGGNPAARNVLYSTSKKQGKSTLAGAVALYMASRRRYAEVVIAAADLDQAKDRVFKSVKYAVENSPAWQSCKVYKDIIELNQGSIIQALPFDWRGAAGGNYDCVIFDELWAYTSENHRRQFDELIIPPQKPDGVRWVTSYAGWEGESHLLRELWNKVLSGKRIGGELPLYQVPDASLIGFIDTGEVSWRMWNTPQYMDQVKQSERQNTYRRLWCNEWVSNESEFITSDAWQACYSPDVKPIGPGDKRKMTLGADASTARDYTSLVGVHDTGGVSDVCFVRVWKPAKGILRQKATIDLSETIGAEILKLHKAGMVEAVYYDPYQLHSIALDLTRAGVRMVELPQTGARTEADQALYDAIMGRTLRHYNDPGLNEAIGNAVAIETPRGFRLAKEKTSRKIDAAVALSMAHFGAVEAARTGGVTTIPNIFYAYSNPDGSTGDLSKWVQLGEAWEYVPELRPRHSKGATSWRDCQNSNKGCQECINELRAEGYYDMLDQEAAEAAGKVAMSEEDAREVFLLESGLLNRLKTKQQEAQNEHKILQSFWKSVRGQ